ncbi:MAG: disulfide oxidoreductase [Gemmatales bacterium]
MDLAQLTWTVVPVLSALVALGHAIIIVSLSAHVYDWFSNGSSAVTVWIGRHGLVLMFIVAITAMLGSLYFSEISGWTPCKDCWLQRIFMYPQVVLLTLALWKRDTKIAPYILALCLIGMCFSAYHYFIQMQNIIASPTNPATPCDASGVSCVKTPFVEFGYITIPLMAFTGFLLNAVGAASIMKVDRRSACS